MTLWTVAVYANVFPTYWTERGMRRFDGRIVFMDPVQALRRSEVPLFLDDPDLIALAERRSAERAGRHGERPGQGCTRPSRDRPAPTEASTPRTPHRFVDIRGPPPPGILPAMDDAAAHVGLRRRAVGASFEECEPTPGPHPTPALVGPKEIEHVL